MCLVENIHVLDELRLGMSDNAVGHEFNVNELIIYVYIKQGGFKQKQT